MEYISPIWNACFRISLEVFVTNYLFLQMSLRKVLGLVLTFVLLGVIRICIGANGALHIAFFPSEAISKGATKTECGLIFTIYFFVQSLASPLVGKHLYKIGVRNMLIGGVFLVGITGIASGTMQFLDDKIQFLSGAGVIRSIEGLAMSPFKTSFICTIMELYSGHSGVALSSLQSMKPAGTSLGPFFGGLLYEYFGYFAPFYACGICLLICSSLLFFLLPKNKSEEKVAEMKSVGILQVLKIPAVSVCIFSIFVTTFAQGFMNVSYTPRLEEFNFSHSDIGFTYLSIGLPQFIACLFCGRILDKGFSPLILIFISTLFMTVGFIFFGPLHFIPITPSAATTITAAVFYGLSWGITFITSLMGAKKYAEEHFKNANLAVKGTVSGIFVSAYSLGLCVSPVLSGFLIDSYGIRVASIVIFVLQLVLLLSFLLVLKGSRPRTVAIGKENGQSNLGFADDEPKSLRKSEYP